MIPPYAYLVNQNGSANFAGAWIPTSGLHKLTFGFSWSAIALTAGALYIEGTNDPGFTKAAAHIVRYADLSWWLKSTGALSTTGNVIGTSADASQIMLVNLPAFVRAGGAMTAGGGADQIQAFAQGD